ncbi:MAG: type IV toxin-antitoxin system AbiEi family antitoxin [Myxococcota bacterium]
MEQKQVIFVNMRSDPEAEFREESASRLAEGSREQEIVETALRSLGESTGLHGTFSRRSKPGRGDGVLTLSRDETRRPFAVEVKSSIRRVHIPALLETLGSLGQPAVLLTRHVTAPLADELARHGINFVDTAGNAHIAHEGWFIFVKGRSAPGEHAPTTLGASVWKVAYALLRDPHLRTAPIRRLAERAGVSPGGASIAIRALHDRGWVRNLGRERVVVRQEALWRAWEMGWIDRLAARLLVTRAVAPSHASVQDWRRWWTASPHPEVLVGGELGAQLLGTGIVAETATLHVERWDASMLARLRLVPATGGPFTVRQVFGDLAGDPDAPGVAHPMLVRADLLTILDERLDESRETLARRIESQLPDAP